LYNQNTFISLHPKLNQMINLKILKLTDRDDPHSDSQYFTIKKLREYILDEWYDIWEEAHAPHQQDYTKEQIAQSDNDMFEWLSGWGYDIEIVYNVTSNDFN